jgi:hypothetical protein
MLFFGLALSLRTEVPSVWHPADLLAITALVGIAGCGVTIAKPGRVRPAEMFWYPLAFWVIAMFFSVTYPNGFIVFGWVAFYSLWYLGLALVIFPLVVFALPYVGRMSEWEAERVKVQRLARLFAALAVHIERRAKRIAEALMRSAIVMEYHVVDQCAKMYHREKSARERLFIEHIEKTVARVLRRNGKLSVLEGIRWRP